MNRKVREDILSIVGENINYSKVMDNGDWIEYHSLLEGDEIVDDRVRLSEAPNDQIRVTRVSTIVFVGSKGEVGNFLRDTMIC